MPVKQISISNFKSFDNLEVNLSNLNILIGANASGKSNFLEIFQFLKDIAIHSLNDAISMQGGVEYLRNVKLGASRPLSIKITYNPNWKFGRNIEQTLIGEKTTEITYEFVLEFYKTRRGFKIASDKLTRKLDFVGLEEDKKGDFQEKTRLGSGEFILFNNKGKLDYHLNLPQGLTISAEDFFPSVFKNTKLSKKTLLLETPFFTLPYPFEKFFEDITIYNFDPKLPKKAVSITGRTELEPDGSNLAIVLKNILDNKDAKRMFSNLLKDMLPFIEDFRIAKFADKSLLVTLREKYAQNVHLPASFVSDGTLNITALIIALYFEEKTVTIIEEPERNIHPFLIGKLINMFEEVSKDKQTIITTHNPEMIRFANLNDILLISRSEYGFSSISKPVKQEAVQIFLENELAITDLYVQDLLGV